MNYDMLVALEKVSNVILHTQSRALISKARGYSCLG